MDIRTIRYLTSSSFGYNDWRKHSLKIFLKLWDCFLFLNRIWAEPSPYFLGLLSGIWPIKFPSLIQRNVIHFQSYLWLIGLQRYTQSSEISHSFKRLLKYSSSGPHSDFLSISQKIIYLSSLLLSYPTKSFLIFVSGTSRKDQQLPSQFVHLLLLNFH